MNVGSTEGVALSGSPGAGDAPLVLSEHLTISTRVVATMLGTGLLATGLVHAWLAPAQAQVGLLLQALAALIVAFPIVRAAIVGLVADPPRALTEQLVALAVLAAIAAGDFVTAVLIPVFLEVGHLFEERSARGAQASIRDLRSLCVPPATLVDGDHERPIDPSALRRGDVVSIRPGERIPADGLVRFGQASVDQSSITGESRPRAIERGDDVFAGTLNLDGWIRVEVVEASGGTVLGEVVRLLEEVEHSKTPAVRLIERAARGYLPFVLAVATAVVLATGDLSRFIAVLIVACPCALVLAGPAAIVAAMSTATRQRILIKSAAFLERIADVDTLVLDKTGTVTRGRQTVDAISSCSDCEPDEILALAASVAFGSRHPTSRALVEAAEAAGRARPEATDVREVPGCGVRGRVGDATLRVGRADWLVREGVSVPSDASTAPGTGVCVARDEQLLGTLSLFDETRRDAGAAIASMRTLGFRRLVLLTGDRRAAAERVGADLGADEIIAEVLPAEKLALVRREQEAGRRVLMVGDGVNDALALAAADVGVAMGPRASQVALGGADVALLADELDRLPAMVALADKTRDTIVQNVILGAGFSSVMLAIASAGWISPLWGALLHNAGAIMVIGNSSRLLADPKREGAE